MAVTVINRLQEPVHCASIKAILLVGIYGATTMAGKALPAGKIVDTALEQAEACSWEAVRLHGVARAMGVTLDDIRGHFREKEELVDAWFDRADRAMLREAEEAGFAELSGRERLHRLLMAWLGALAPHRRPTRQMIIGKLEPGHLHYQIAGLLRVSRTVQWMREAAGRKAVLPWRAIEETALTGIYLLVFAFWMRDDSPASRNTSRLLDRCLTGAEAAAHCCCPQGDRRRSSGAKRAARKPGKRARSGAVTGSAKDPA
jgi:AcrR family transcriptional regulator